MILFHSHYLQEISIEDLKDALKLIEAQFELLGLKSSECYSPRSRIKGWLDWYQSQGDFGFLPQQTQPEFNTFYTNGIRRKQPKPGKKLHDNRCPVYSLCAKNFPDDYINPRLKQEFEDYEAWRLANNVKPGSIKTEKEQIFQFMGWLHRYENISLEELSFKCLISKSQLIFLIKDYDNFSIYLYEKEKGTQAAREQAKSDIDRIKRYLDFVSGHPNSQKKRVSLLTAMGKFIYQDLIGSDDFPRERDIPIIQRLLNLQVELGKKAKSVANTISYHETSVSWKEAITAMEKQRRRAEQVVIYSQRNSPKGYSEKQRPETAIANDLQKFLSLVFCLLVPSRSRTFYDLRIGETFKEGILTENKFLSVADLKEKGVWEKFKERVRFYIHHQADDYKTGKAMAPVLLNNGGWWVELPNQKFGQNQCLYDYVRRWLEWGRYAEGAVEHNFFFREASSPKPMKVGDWGSRIRTMFANWTGVSVSPGSIRKMFASQFPKHREGAALLLQHSEQMHNTNYDMRHSIQKMQPVIEANQQFINEVLNSLADKEFEEEEVQLISSLKSGKKVEKAEVTPLSTSTQYQKVEGNKVQSISSLKSGKKVEKAEVTPLSTSTQHQKVEGNKVQPISQSKQRKKSASSDAIQLTLDFI